MSRRGFTLLELLVASTIMAIAVVGLLSNLSTSMRNAARLTDYDRAAVLARSKIDEMLLNSHLPPQTQGVFEPAVTGGTQAGWSAQLSPLEIPPGARPGTAVIEQLHFTMWWDSGSGRRTMVIDGYRTGQLPPEFVARP